MLARMNAPHFAPISGAACRRITRRLRWVASHVQAPNPRRLSL